MKKVLIEDRHDFLGDFLKQKLEEDQTKVILSMAARDLYTKMITSQPDLIILDIEKDYQEELDFLVNKYNDSNTSGIPVIIAGEKQDRSNIAALAKYGVIKYFEKPIQFDMFFSSIGRSINIPLSLDTTPCVLDLHRNNNIIFIELALGLNSEKIALLKFKLSEMIKKEKINSPKIILMLTNIDLTFVDGFSLESLINNILECPKVYNHNVKILSFSPFVKEFLKGHKNYAEIEISTELPSLLNSLVDTTASLNVSELITNQILATSGDLQQGGSIATRFSTEDADPSMNKNKGAVLNVAIIDSNEKTLELTKKSFETIGASCFCYMDKTSFYKDYETKKFDFIILNGKQWLPPTVNN